MRTATVRVAIALAFVCVAGAMALTGVAFALWAGFLWLRDTVGPAPAALAMSAIVLITAGGLIWTAQRIAR